MHSPNGNLANNVLNLSMRNEYWHEVSTVPVILH
jgi:hypothetical protein